MEKIEIKKALYKENPNAILTSIKKGNINYSAHIPSLEVIIQFEVPFGDIGDAKFLSSMDSKLLIRWIV